MGSKELFHNQTVFQDYNEVFIKIDNLIHIKNKVVVAIDGNCGSGKTTLAEAIAQTYDCNVFHMDNFFLRPEQRTDERLGEIGGNVDYERFHKEVIKGIKSMKDFEYSIYNCKLMKLTDTIQVKSKQLNIIEGSYSMHPTLSRYFDLKIFLSINEKEQRRRIMERNGQALLKMFTDVWIPKENQYFEQMKIMEQCDIVINVLTA